MTSTRVRALLLVAAATLGSAQPTQADPTLGAWQTWTDLPFFPVHNHLLPTGKVMIWPGDQGINGDQVLLLDPATQNLATGAQAGYDLFCSGHAFLADGNLLVAGGHIANNIGVARASQYQPGSNSWRTVPDMNAGRWYPTVTTLANGDALVVSGDVDTTLGVNTMPQVFQAESNSWRNLPSAQLQQPLYPMMFLAPNGSVVDVGPSETTRYLNTTGSGRWKRVGQRLNGYRDYGSAVMYADGKVLFVGGGSPPTANAEVLDLNQSSPAWRAVAPMSVPRRQLNATLLPDGKVLVTGGTSGPGFNDATNPVFATQVWDPDSETWTPLAPARVPRLYHSGATLLPDGRVLSTGGNGYTTPEVFSPPYLFKGARPVIESAPESLAYGQRFAVASADAASVTKVTLIRLSSVTHGFNQNQRLNVLSFAAAAGALDITAPASGRIAPPGHYLLFLVNGSGVPSMGKLVQLGVGTAPPPPPTGTHLLTVEKTGSESRKGTITSSPAGINCGSNCTANFAEGVTVTLTANVVGNAQFAGWGGACSGTGSCAVEMSADQSVTANFQRR